MNHNLLRRRVIRATVVAALGYLPQHAIAQPYGIATMPPGTVAHTSAVAIAKVLKEKARLNMLVQPAAGESVLIPMVSRGEIDFGVANAVEVLDAVRGPAAHANTKLRLIATLHPLRVAVFARKNGNIRSLADLKGKRLPMGFSAIQTAQTIALSMLAMAGYQAADLKPVLVPNVIAGADAFLNNGADAFVLAFGAPKLREVDASVGGIRALELPNSIQALAASRRIFPFGYLTEVQPGPIFTGIERPAKVYSFDYMLFTNADVKDEVVYKLLDTLVSSKADLVSIAPHLREFSAVSLRKSYDVAFHPGALKYFAEHNIAVSNIE